MNFWYDNYTKILHIGGEQGFKNGSRELMIGLGGFTDWAINHQKNDDIGLLYLRIGKLAFSYRRKRNGM